MTASLQSKASCSARPGQKQTDSQVEIASADGVKGTRLEVLLFTIAAGEGLLLQNDSLKADLG